MKKKQLIKIEEFNNHTLVKKDQLMIKGGAYPWIDRKEP